MKNRGRSILVAAFVLGLSVTGVARAAQDPAPSIADFEDAKIVAVRITGLENLRPQVVLAELRTRAGSKLDARAVRDDLAFLWSRFKLQCRVFVEPRGPANARTCQVRFDVIKEFFLFERMSFRGMDHLSEKTAKRRLGIDEIERLTELTGYSLAQRLTDIYRQDGYPNARVDVEPDRATSTLLFRVDEGPFCSVERVEFSGNETYPSGNAFLSSFGWNLLGSAGVKSKPHGLFPGLLNGAAYSRKTVLEDLNRLRTFYRGQGFKDAVVELSRVAFNADWTEVELGIRIVEGRRYRIGKVDVRVEGFPKGSDPLIGVAEIRDLMRIREGEIYRKSTIDDDVIRIARFYGRKGFPSRVEHPRLDAASSFSVPAPVEVLDVENATVDIVFNVIEGKRKRLRNLVIRGNTGTRDSVIRREISVWPGEILDSVELARSQERLLGLRYFGDPATGDPGVDFALLPVETDPELVDLDILVSEGSTGQILWGGGISSNNGPFANIQYRKTNFDWRNAPSGWNPFGWMSQIINNEAFHGGGQTFNLDLSPGTQLSQASASFYEPDLFGSHIDTIGFGIDVFRRIRLFESYDEDKVGLGLRVDKRIGRDVSVGFRVRDERIKIGDIAADAPRVIWDADGKTRLRSIGLNMTVSSMDRNIQPTEGYRVSAAASLAPEWLESQARFWKTSLRSSVYLPLHRDERERAHTLTVRNTFGYGEAIQGNQELYLPERYFLGGQSQVRGFRYRRAGPTQFGRPTGGEALYHGALEYGFPIPGASTRLQRSLVDTEILRGAAFVDWGFLGTSLDDPLFDQARVTAGMGLHIRIPGLSPVPIALYFAWPIRSQETDRRQVFSFTFSSF